MAAVIAALTDTPCEPSGFQMIRRYQHPAHTSKAHLLDDDRPTLHGMGAEDMLWIVLDIEKARVAGLRCGRP
jgi:hypothetical protein